MSEFFFLNEYEVAALFAARQFIMSECSEYRFENHLLANLAIAYYNSEYTDVDVFIDSVKFKINNSKN